MPTREPFVYEHACEKLIEFVPELEDAYRRELNWWGSERPGPHVIYEDIFVPYINQLLDSTRDESDTILRRVFEFIELLAGAADERMHDLVAVAICKPLIADHVRLHRARAYMGRATLGILKKVSG